jgi:hypothetical protein
MVCGDNLLQAVHGMDFLLGVEKSRKGVLSHEGVFKDV